MTDQNFQDEEERQQYAAWRAGYQDPEAAARGAWIAAKHGWAIAQSLQADFAQLKEQMADAKQVVPKGYRLQPLSEYDAMCAFIAAAPQPPAPKQLDDINVVDMAQGVDSVTTEDARVADHLRDAAKMT